MRTDDIKAALEDLILMGRELIESLTHIPSKNEIKDFNFFGNNYERWYTTALPIVKQLVPDRYKDFVLLYKDDKRKQLTGTTYTISDALRNATHYMGDFGPWTAYLCMMRQWQIIKACLDSLDSKVRSIQTILQADVFDSEIESAKHLCKMGFLRAAGAICGVIIEKHLSQVCANRELTPKKKTPTIADFNDLLKDNAYDTIEWRRIQRLGDIRNLCDHNKEREPSKDEVEELISGTERITKTIF